MKNIAFAVLIYFLSFSYSYAMTGNEWLEQCGKEKENIDQEFCLGYLAGLHDMNALRSSIDLYLLIEGKYFPAHKDCEPKGIILEQWRKIVVKWLNANPERLHENFDFLFVKIIASVYPCT